MKNFQCRYSLQNVSRRKERLGNATGLKRFFNLQKKRQNVSKISHVYVLFMNVSCVLKSIVRLRFCYQSTELRCLKHLLGTNAYQTLEVVSLRPKRHQKYVLISRLNVYPTEIQISTACLMIKLSLDEMVQMKHET